VAASHQQRQGDFRMDQRGTGTGLGGTEPVVRADRNRAAQAGGRSRADPAPAGRTPAGRNLAAPEPAGLEPAGPGSAARIPARTPAALELAVPEEAEQRRADRSQGGRNPAAPTRADQAGAGPAAAALAGRARLPNRDCRSFLVLPAPNRIERTYPVRAIASHFSTGLSDFRRSRDRPAKLAGHWT
jgi:hypothetical protein